MKYETKLYSIVVQHNNLMKLYRNEWDLHNDLASMTCDGANTVHVSTSWVSLVRSTVSSSHVVVLIPDVTIALGIGDVGWMIVPLKNLWMNEIKSNTNKWHLRPRSQILHLWQVWRTWPRVRDQFRRPTQQVCRTWFLSPGTLLLLECSRLCFRGRNIGDVHFPSSHRRPKY